MARTYSLVGWDEYQHYGKRNSVPWVKLHRDTLTSLTWIKGDERARIVMIGSMALAARYQNAIPLDWELLKNGLALKWTEEQFMIALRYLVASNFIALSEQDDSNTLEQEEKSRRDKIPPKSPKGETDEKFEAFLKAYPSRGKAANPTATARKAWDAAKARGADPDELIRAAPTAAPAEKHGTEFVPQAATWLNQNRFNDIPKETPVAEQIKIINGKPEFAWRDGAKSYAERKYWPAPLGPEPGSPGCQCPQEIIDVFCGPEAPAFLRRQAAVG